jgi:hypothetical protein
MEHTRAFTSSVANKQCNTSPQYILSGNITPSQWYQEFTTSKGTADLALISVLSEIIYWYRPKRVKDPVTGNITYVTKFLGDAWQTSYEHFQRRLGFNREKLRRIFVKLEQMEICLREFRDVKLRGQTYNNRLFIHLSSSFLDSCIDNKTNKKVSQSENHNTSSNPSFFAEKEEGGYPRFRGDHIIDKENKKNIKDRSTEFKSNFLENSFEEEKILESPKPSICNKTEEDRVVTVNEIKNTFALGKELKDFYPLTKEDCQILQSNSGREFSLNSMNEILLDMSKRITDRYFKSKKGFLSYMSKVFSYEMRDAVKINNENFKIRNNQSKEEQDARHHEEYLTKIEYSLEVSPEWHFKKRLAARLPRKTAYKLLKSFDAIDIKAGIFNLHLSKYVDLTDIDKKLILQEAQSTHEKLDFADERLGYIQDIKIIMPEKITSLKHINQNKTQELSLPTGVWGRVRQRLISIYGEAIDRNWFSKLTPCYIDEKKKEIKLKVPTSFVRDWIKENYLNTIENIFLDEQIESVDLITVR